MEGGVAKAFQDLKDKISSIPILKFPNFTTPFEVHANMNDFTIGGVFMQDGQQITFKTKKLYGAQLHWPPRKELYIVMCYLKHGNTTWGHIRPRSTQITSPCNILKCSQGP
jgi:hypothetical protein